MKEFQQYLCELGIMRKCVVAWSCEIFILGYQYLCKSTDLKNMKNLLKIFYVVRV